MNFSERLKEAMLVKGLKQTDLAVLSGLDKSLISNYLSGKYKARQENLYILANALDVSETWLMGYDVPMKREKPATNNGDRLIGELSPNDLKIIELLMSLSDSKKAEAIRYLRYLAEQSDKL